MIILFVRFISSTALFGRLSAWMIVFHDTDRGLVKDLVSGVQDPIRILEFLEAIEEFD